MGLGHQARPPDRRGRAICGNIARPYPGRCLAQHHEPYDPNLTLDFTPDKEGLAQARQYARTIMVQGAVLAEMSMRVNIRDKHGISVETVNYWSDEPAPTNPADL